MTATAKITGSSDLERRLTINGYFFIDTGPIKEFLSIGRPHIDTTVAHRVAKIIVPISAVKGKAGGRRNPGAGKKHHVGNIGQIVVVVAGAAGHLGRPEFRPDGELAGGGFVPFAGGNQSFQKQGITLVSGQGLIT